MARNARLIAAMLVLLAATMSLSHAALAAEKKGTLTADVAQERLKALNPGISVESVRPAPLEGLYEVVLVLRGQKKVVYMDPSGENLLDGFIFNLTTRVNLTQERVDEITSVDVSLIPLDHALVLGKKTAEHKVVVFDDPD